MTYREIVLELAQNQVETLTEVLFECDEILSLSVEDAQAGEEQEQALFGEPGLEPAVQAWQRSRLVLLIDGHTDPVKLLNDLQKEFDLDTGAFQNYEVRELVEQDWVRLTQAQFAPISIGQRIWIVPSWHNVPVQGDMIAIELDPGMAFGTGSHATTQLCIQWLESHLQIADSVLDYGCGSGILAIVAKKLGAAAVRGIDIDANAVIAARANAQRNQVTIDFSLPDEAPSTSVDVVVANILSNPLKLMAAMLSAKVKPGGQLVLSGVLARQAHEVIDSYAPWIDLSIWKEAEGWVCLAGSAKIAN